MDEQINYNLTNIATWKRIFFMLIFIVITGLVRMLLWAVILLQAASALLTGRANTHILHFGRSLSLYTYNILLFLTFNTETLPFPFSDWNQSSEPKLPDQ